MIDHVSPPKRPKRRIRHQFIIGRGPFPLICRNPIPSCPTTDSVTTVGGYLTPLTKPYYSRLASCRRLSTSVRRAAPAAPSP